LTTLYPSALKEASKQVQVADMTMNTSKETYINQKTTTKEDHVPIGAQGSEQIQR